MVQASHQYSSMISAGCVLFVMGLNLLTVRLFGEIEFWFALIKILAIIGT